MPKDKNQKDPHSAKHSKHFSTRQIIELTERRRAQMLAAALVEQSKQNKQSAAVPPPAEAPASEPSNETPQVTETTQTTENVHPSFPDGKTAAQIFRQEAETTKEQEIAQVIEHQWDLAAKDVKLSQAPEIKTVDDRRVHSRPPEIVSAEQSTSFIRDEGPVNIFVVVSAELGLTITMFTLFFILFLKFLTTGYSTTSYDHGPYLLLISALYAWHQRDRLQRRERVSWRWIAQCLCGIGIFSWAAVEGSLYGELAGLILCVLAVFFGLYTAASARLLVFPLSYLMFVVPPPDQWMDAVASWLNTAIIHTGYFFLYCVNVPGSIHGLNLYFSTYELSLDGNLAGVRSIITFAALAVLYIRIQKTTALGKSILALSVVPLVIFGNALHIALTTWVTFNYGLKYAQIFFQEYSGAVTFLSAFICLGAIAYYWEEEQTV